MEVAAIYATTVAFLGWVLWLRDRRAETVAERLADLGHRAQVLNHRLDALNETIGKFSTVLNETRAIVDNLSMKAGLGGKR